MGYKSRGNYGVDACFKPCANRGALCEDCVCSRMFKPLEVKDGVSKGVRDVQGVQVVDKGSSAAKKEQVTDAQG